VLTGWSEDLTQIPFETVPGFKELVSNVEGPSKTGLAHILSPTEPSLSKEEALREALAFGAVIAGGTFDNGRFHYGGDLYTAAAARLGDDLFCEPCGDKSWSCAIRTLHRIAGTAASAAEFLEQTPATEAAKSYRAIESTASGYHGKQLESKWDDSAFRTQLKQSFLHMHDLHSKAAASLVAGPR
jgi:hypothetical protein